MATNIENNYDALRKVLLGVKKTADAITCTMGPGGRLVAISPKVDGFSKVRITKDGATVAENIKSLDNLLENTGCQMIKDISKKMSDETGDGSTTVVQVAKSLMHQSFNLIQNGFSLNDVQKALDLLEEKSTKEIKSMIKIIDADSKEMEQIATIASNGNTSIGNQLADLFKKLGKDGMILVETSKTGETYTDIKEGFYFDKGASSPSFFKVDEQQKMKIEFENAYVLVVEQKVNSLNVYLDILQKVAQSGKPLILVADDFDNDVITAFVFNRIRMGLNAICIKAPGFGDRKSAFLEDLAIMTDAKLVSDALGVTPDKITLEDLGIARKIQISKDSTTILNIPKNPHLKEQRINGIKSQLEAESSSYEKDKLKERLARMTNGVGTIYVGAKTETEASELKDRVEDATHACRNALKGGIVPGAGTEFLWSMFKIRSEIENSNNTVEKILLLMTKSLESPTRKIICNTCKASSDVILNQIFDGFKSSNEIGFNGTTGKVDNLLSSGIVNPALVSINALSIATSLCRTFVGIKTILYEDKEDKPVAPPMGGGMPGMGY